MLEQPWLQPWNGVEGIALSYDKWLVASAEHLLTSVIPPEWRGSIEHSRYVAQLLAAVAVRSGEDAVAETDLPALLVDQLFERWQVVANGSTRRRSPIIVEVAVTEGFGREALPRPEAIRDSPYDYHIKRSRGAKLQAAASGGMITAGDRGYARSYGTLGGFLVDDHTLEIFGVTAAHVCNGSTGYALPLPLPRAPKPIRDTLRLMLDLYVRRWAKEECPSHWASRAATVAPQSCTAQATPRTDGLDVALHKVAPQTSLRSAQVADLSDLSPVLNLSFTGATSGFQRVRVTSYSIWHSYTLNETNVCIHDCLQIKLADRPYLRSDLSRGGDSGAWLLARGPGGIHWVGLLTGGDGELAGLVPATRIVERLQTELGSSMSALI
jgi:hypothetical protein